MNASQPLAIFSKEFETGRDEYLLPNVHGQGRARL